MSTSLFVARFTGPRNLLEGLAEPLGDGCRVRIGEHLLLSSHTARSGPVTVGMRPETLELVEGEITEENLLRGCLARQVLRPGHLELEVVVGALRLIAHTRRSALTVGQAVCLQVAPDAVLLLAPEMEQRKEEGDWLTTSRWNTVFQG